MIIEVIVGVRFFPVLMFHFILHTFNRTIRCKKDRIAGAPGTSTVAEKSAANTGTGYDKTRQVANTHECNHQRGTVGA